MKDIGSIFPVYDLHPQESEIQVSKRQYFSLCREILLEIAKRYEHTNRVVLLPAFTCKVVIEPFEQLGWTICYFGVHKNLRINALSFRKAIGDYHPALVLVHPYFGMELNHEEETLLKEAKECGCDIILDNTQCIYSEKRYEWVDYVVGSVRKWIPIPDGAFVESKVPFEAVNGTNDKYVERELEAQYLRGVYYHSEDENVKTISRRLDAEAMDMLDQERISLHAISDFSRNVIASTDMVANAERCRRNFEYLYENLDGVGISPISTSVEDVSTAPLMLPFYTDNRKMVQQKLAKERIYAQYLWPVPSEECLVDEEVKYIYEHHLVFFMDQRYDVEDMDRIISVMNKL